MSDDADGILDRNEAEQRAARMAHFDAKNAEQANKDALALKIAAAELLSIVKLQRDLAAMTAERDALKDWIRSDTEITDTCAYSILHEICTHCRCWRKPK